MGVYPGALVVMFCVSFGADWNGCPRIRIESGGRIFLYRLAM